jgi:hypothetical protein
MMNAQHLKESIANSADFIAMFFDGRAQVPADFDRMRKVREIIQEEIEHVLGICAAEGSSRRVLWEREGEPERALEAEKYAEAIRKVQDELRYKL